MQDYQAMIHYATLAPSGHNTQPWRFAIEGDTIRVMPDFSRRLPVVDPDDHALYISLGCAIENLVIAAGRLGYWAETCYEERNGEAGSLHIRLRRSCASGSSDLFDAIPKRQTNRRVYDGRPAPAEHLKLLLESSAGEGVNALVFSGPKAIERLTAFVEQASRVQFEDQAFLTELIRWIRFNNREAIANRDGVPAAALGLPPAPRWLGKWIMRTFAGPPSEARRQAKLIRSSSALFLFVAEHNDRPHWIELGRAFERTALTATALGIQHAHVNMACEVLPVRREMERELGISPRHALLLVRLGYAPPTGPSPRRGVEEVTSG